MTVWAILAILVVICGLLYGVRKSGKDAVKAEVEAANAEAAARVGQVIVDAPRSKSDVLDRLRDDKRKL